jgi:hypothetical protein
VRTRIRMTPRFLDPPIVWVFPQYAVRSPFLLRASARPWRLGILHPRAPRRSGLFCPGPSSLIRPHPPHSQAHRDFVARRLIRDAFAVRERRGDPRVVLGFGSIFLPACRSLSPGEFDDRRDSVLRQRYCLRRPSSSALCDGLHQVSPAPEGFHFEAFASSVTLAAARHDHSMHRTCRTPPVHTGSENPPAIRASDFAAQI